MGGRTRLYLKMSPAWIVSRAHRARAWNCFRPDTIPCFRRASIRPARMYPLRIKPLFPRRIMRAAANVSEAQQSPGVNVAGGSTPTGDDVVPCGPVANVALLNGRGHEVGKEVGRAGEGGGAQRRHQGRELFVVTRGAVV